MNPLCQLILSILGSAYCIHTFIARVAHSKMNSFFRKFSSGQMLTQAGISVMRAVIPGGASHTESKRPIAMFSTVINETTATSEGAVERCKLCLANTNSGDCRLRVAAHSE